MPGKGSPMAMAAGGTVLLAVGFLLGWWAGSSGGAASGLPGAGRDVVIVHDADASVNPGAPGAGPREKKSGTEGEGAPKPPGPVDPPKKGDPDAGSDPAKTPPVPGPAVGPSSPPPPAHAVPPGPYVLPESIKGRLVDALTSKPIPGATVALLWSTSDGTCSGGMDAELREDGSFSIAAVEQSRGIAKMLLRDEYQRAKFHSEEEASADLEYTLRVSAKGYDTFQKGDPGSSFEVSLQPESRDHLPGTVRVDARMPDDSRFQGRLLVGVDSSDRDNFLQWALPEADGTFLLPGVPAGKWSFNVSGKHDTGTNLVVPEAGEARVTLKVPRKGVQEADGTPTGEPREVSVSTGRDAGAGAFVRAEIRPGLFFRTEVVASTALFPALPAGKWTFVLQVPDKAEVRFAAEVPAGTGRLSLRFP